jgi:hypothetical protein
MNPSSSIEVDVIVKMAIEHDKKKKQTRPLFIR